MNSLVGNWWGFVTTGAASGSGSATATGRRHALIMDEVDGMAGNEDRGGIPVSATVHGDCVCDDGILLACRN